MELLIIILLLIALIISLILNFSFSKTIKALANKTGGKPGDGDRPDLAIHKFQVTPGKDILHVTVIGYDNNESIKARSSQRQPQSKVLTKFSLKTITSKNPAILLAIPTSILIPEEYLSDQPPQSPPNIEGDMASKALMGGDDEEVVAPNDDGSISTPPRGWPPTATEVIIEIQ